MFGARLHPPAPLVHLPAGLQEDGRWPRPQLRDHAEELPAYGLLADDGPVLVGGRRRRRRGKQGALPAPPITPQSLEAPPEVALCLADLVAVEGEDLRVTERPPVGPRPPVGHDHPVALLP